MVRKLVHAQVAVGQDRLSEMVLAQALDERLDVREAAQAEIPAGLAPANGLTLVEVLYDDLV